MKKAATIIDVAKAAGVSPSTVSHAISGKRAISNEVKHRIFEQIRALNYRPSFFAQAMKSNSTKLIGILCQECRNPITSLLVDALASELSRHSYDMVLGMTGLDLVKGREMLRRFSAGMVDGVINMLPQIDSTEAAILCGDVPVVTMMRQDNAPLIPDYAGLVRDILEYLWGQGHRRVGYIASTTRNYNGEDPAIAAYAAFLAARGETLDRGLAVYGSDDIESGTAAMEKICRYAPVTAVFTGNDQMAFGVYRWAYSRGLRIPDDLSVIGCDDTPQAATVTPPLTTGRYPLAEVAGHTVGTLLARINAEVPPAQAKILNLPLIVRDSVKNISL